MLKGGTEDYQEGTNANIVRKVPFTAVSRRIIGKTQSGATVAAGAFTLQWKVPAGYKRCTGVYFNPANDCLVTLYSENLASDIVSAFSTATGTAIGMIDPGHDYAELDIITARVTPRVLASTPQDITISLRFEA